MIGAATTFTGKNVVRSDRLLLVFYFIVLIRQRRCIMLFEELNLIYNAISHKIPMGTEYCTQAHSLSESEVILSVINSLERN